jgi:hypothetical protein
VVGRVHAVLRRTLLDVRFRIMRLPFLILGASLLGAAASDAVIAQGFDPADPQAPSPAAPYRSIFAGTKSYRPVEPLPWDDVNRRVAPPGALPPPASAPGSQRPAQDSGAAQKGTTKP